MITIIITENYYNLLLVDFLYFILFSKSLCVCLLVGVEVRCLAVILLCLLNLGHHYEKKMNCITKKKPASYNTMLWHLGPFHMYRKSTCRLI